MNRRYFVQFHKKVKQTSTLLDDGGYQETRHKLTTLIGSKFELSKKTANFFREKRLCLTLLAVIYLYIDIASQIWPQKR